MLRLRTGPLVAAIGQIYTAQFIQPPMLDIHTKDNGVNLSWIMPSTNFVLQQTADVVASNWAAIADTPSFDPTTMQQSITMPATESNRFYRMTLVP